MTLANSGGNRDSGFDASAHLREAGWLLPTYTPPADCADLSVPHGARG